MKKNLLMLNLCMMLTQSNTYTQTISLHSVKDHLGHISPDFFTYITGIFKTDVLIETGTYNGQTICHALPYFKSIYSVELAPQLYTKAKERFAHNPTVHLYLGNSAEVLTTILPTITGKILFWLDGHYSGGSTAKGESNTPIIGELHAIKESNIKDAVILIDDIRIFGCAHRQDIDETLIGYPTIHQLLDAVRTINPDYTLVIYGDIALAFLSSEPVDVSPLIKACTTSRFCMEEPNSHELQVAENIIKQATQEEKEALCDLYRSFASHDPYNLATIYKRWYHLISKK